MAVVTSAAIMCNFLPAVYHQGNQSRFPCLQFKECHRPKSSRDVGTDYVLKPFFSLFHFPYETALWNSDSTNLFLATALVFEAIKNDFKYPSYEKAFVRVFKLCDAPSW